MYLLYKYNSFRIANPYSCEKQIYQIEYSICMHIV